MAPLLPVGLLRPSSKSFRSHRLSSSFPARPQVQASDQPVRRRPLVPVTTSGLSRATWIGAMHWRGRRRGRSRHTWSRTPAPPSPGPSGQPVLAGSCGSFTALGHHRATGVSPPRTGSFTRWHAYLLLNFSMLQDTALLKIPGIPAANFMPQFPLNAVGVGPAT